MEVDYSIKRQVVILLHALFLFFDATQNANASSFLTMTTVASSRKIFFRSTTHTIPTISSFIHSTNIRYKDRQKRNILNNNNSSNNYNSKLFSTSSNHNHELNDQSASTKSLSQHQLQQYQSYVQTIKCQNFVRNAASTHDNKSNEIIIHLGNNENDSNSKQEQHEAAGPNLVAITGESGSGKSLLVFKVFQLVLGDKVSPTIMTMMNNHNNIRSQNDDRGQSEKHYNHEVSKTNFISGEVILKIAEPHLTFVQSLLITLLGVNDTSTSSSLSSHFLPIDNDGFASLSLKRTVIQGQTGGQKNNNNSKQRKGRRIHNNNENNKIRLKSQCEINGKQVTLKTLRSIAKPLITLVDANVASLALSQNKARLAIIDTGISKSILSNVQLARKEYRQARKNREAIERELMNRVMPVSFIPINGDEYSDDNDRDGENIELLQHWIGELDTFQSRLSTFQREIVSSPNAATLLLSNDNNDYDDNSSDNDNDNSFVSIFKRFSNCSWENDMKASIEDRSSMSSSFYSRLLDLRDGIKKLDLQYASAQASCDALTSLSSLQSVASALEASRNHLFDATATATMATNNGRREDNYAPLHDAAEQCHELLNKLENALASCASFMSDHPSGLMSIICKMRESVSVSVEDIDFLIADWGLLARKHGVSPFLLPQLQHSLRQELDGNVEARLLLPKAKAEENAALKNFEDACKDLSKARSDICASLTKSVTLRLKDLGMDGSSFTSQLNDGVYKCTDSIAYSDGASLGIDSVDFILSHRNSGNDSNSSNRGNLDVIGSSGEKARLLLAIETILPGSVGASCNIMALGNDVSAGTDKMIENPGPVSIVYDEIDAHVGGNAAVSIGKLLADQTQRKNANSECSRSSQIVSITHSPSLAAIADRHIVVKKLISTDTSGSNDQVLVASVKGMARLEEIARMASGDLAVEESIHFAEALLRDGLKYKQSKGKGK